MPVPNYDNKLVGRYIRAIENPDSSGYRNGRWYEPSYKGHDSNNRGFGVDVEYNGRASSIANDRKGKWLSEQEERDLRNSFIEYSQKILEKRTPKILRQQPSERKRAMATGILYRGEGIKSIMNNPKLREAYFSGSDEDFQNAVDRHYRQEGYSERANRHSQFMNTHKQNNTKAKDWKDYGFKLKNHLSEGGQLVYPSKWDDLTMAQKSDVMAAAVRNGITTLQDIRQKWNEFAEGGYLDDGTVGDYDEAITSDAVKENYGVPSPHYDNVWTWMTDKLPADERGHYNDIVKLPNHPSSSVRGTFSDDGRYFNLTDFGMGDPNYSLFGLVNNGDTDTILRYNDAYVLPEVTVTGSGNYYDDTYDNSRFVKNTFDKGGYIPPQALRRDISTWEGDSMRTNRSFDAEAADFNRVVPSYIRKHLSQQQLDALYSYGYNVGMGNLKKRVVPTLRAYINGNASAQDVASSMTATRDKDLLGLRRRRYWERSNFLGNTISIHDAMRLPQSIVGRSVQASGPDRSVYQKSAYSLPTLNTGTGFTDIADSLQQIPARQTQSSKIDFGLPANPTDYGTPVDFSSLFHEDSDDTALVEKKNTDRGLGILNLMASMGMFGDSNQQPLETYEPPAKNDNLFVLQPTASPDPLPFFANGGHLYGDGGETDTIDVDYVTPREMYINPDTGYVNTANVQNGSVILPDATVTAYSGKDGRNVKTDDGDYYNTSDSAYPLLYGDKVSNQLNNVLLGSMAAATAPVTLPELASAITPIANATSDALMTTRFGKAVNDGLNTINTATVSSTLYPWLDNGVTSFFGAHGINDIKNGNANIGTAFELMPLAQLAKPMYNAARTIITEAPDLMAQAEKWARGVAAPKESQSFITYADNNSTLIENEINKALNAAKAYRESPQYKALITKARKEAIDAGIGDFPEEAFATNNERFPSIVTESRPKGHIAAYDPADNSIHYDPNQIKDLDEFRRIIFHEGLHWQKVGKPDMYIGPKFEKWKTDMNNQSLWYDYILSPDEVMKHAQRDAADAYLKNKVDQALSSAITKDADANDYLRHFGELNANGLEAGKYVGIEPFAPYPGEDIARQAIKKARSYNDYLDYVKAGGEDDVKRFWDILSGQYIPALVPAGGITGTLFSAYPKGNNSSGSSVIR